MKKPLLLAALFAVGCGGTAVSTDEASSNDVAPTGRGETLAAAKPTGQAATLNITLHGGPVLLGTTNVYTIWYGNWTTTKQNIINTYLNNVGGSPYFNINTTYYNSAGTHVSNSVKLAGSTTDNYSQGTALSDAAVQAVVSSAITSGRLPSDTNALYFVLTSADVNETSGFCTSYCGWHTHATINGAIINYSWVGDPSTRCPASCEGQTASSPNGDPGADGMASVVAHELEETVTDPQGNAWYDSKGAENGDKCAWTWGTTSTASNGSMYNITLGGSQFLIQRNWVAATQACAMSY